MSVRGPEGATKHGRMARLCAWMRFEWTSFWSSRWLVWLGGVVIQLLVAVLVREEVILLPIPDEHSLSDLWAWSFLGAREQGFRPDDPWDFPILWIIFQAYLLFLLADYAIERLSGHGAQAFMRSTSRISWILRTLAAEELVVVMWYLQYGIVLAGIALPSGALRLSGSLVGVAYLWAPLLMSMALVAIQLSASLLASPLLASVVVDGLLVTSVYTNTPLLLGSLGMLLRTRALSEMGYTMEFIAGVCAAAVLAAALLAMLAMRRFDVLERDVSDRWT